MVVYGPCLHAEVALPGTTIWNDGRLGCGTNRQIKRIDPLYEASLSNYGRRPLTENL
jgi:hypothetical protein